MYRIMVLLLSCWLFSGLISAQVKLVVLSERGLNMRDMPDLSGKKLVTIPHKAIVTRTDSDAIGKKTNIRQKVKYNDTGEVEYNEINDRYAFKIGSKYGYWVEVKYKNYEGWAFSGWLGTEDESIDNLEWLNELPRAFFVHASPDETLTYDCFGGIEHVYIQNIKTQADVWMDYGQDGNGYQVQEVNKSGNRYLIKVIDMYGFDNDDKDVFTLEFIKKAEDQYVLKGLKDESRGLIPIQHFKGLVVQECERNP